jgi:hypothetical protein
LVVKFINLKREKAITDAKIKINKTEIKMGTQLTYLNKPNLEKQMDDGKNSSYEFVA